MNKDKIICHIGTLSECDNVIKISSNLDSSISSGYFSIDENKECSFAALDFIKIVEANKYKDFAIDLSTNIFVLNFFIEHLIKITLSEKYGQYINSLTICVDSFDDAKIIDRWIDEIIKTTTNIDEWWNLK